MSVDWFGFSLFLLTAIMTYTAVQGRHLLLSVSAAGLWAGLLAFILTNTAIITADNRTILIVSVIGFIVALFLLGVFRDIKSKSSTQEFSIFGDESEYTGARGMAHRLNSDEIPPPKSHSGMSERAEDYRENRVRPALRRKH